MTICQIILQPGWQLDCVSNVTGQQLLVNCWTAPAGTFILGSVEMTFFCGSPHRRQYIHSRDKDPRHENLVIFTIRGGNKREIFSKHYLHLYFLAIGLMATQKERRMEKKTPFGDSRTHSHSH
jgi:hypothetical protein